MIRTEICTGWVVLDDDWLDVHSDDIELVGWPTCSICGRPLRRGSLVDRLWPHYWEYCMHKQCKRRIENAA